MIAVKDNIQDVSQRITKNHTVKDNQIKVDPIKYLKDINSIKKLLKDNLRDYALFIIGG